ncbi:MAG: cysteine protease StiP family protein [Acidimicrobiales bacterium]
MPRFGSYPAEDVTFLLKDLSGLMDETGLADREEAIQSGHHYCEMLPIEYRPTPEYQGLFHRSLTASAGRVAECVAIVADRVVAVHGPDVVLVSLARAGTPVGVLLRRYLSARHRLDVPHYSISIIRGRGLDMNAVTHVRRTHAGRPVQFVDGWTGKGAIQRELIGACRQGPAAGLAPELAVLADPGHCTPLFGTRDDFLVPSACLNATVSGLVSRTVLRRDLIGSRDFHGAKFYRELAAEDVSNLFVDVVSAHFTEFGPATAPPSGDGPVTWEGERAVARIGERYAIGDVNLIKPGVGEATRVLLRRLPWKILVHPDRLGELEHLVVLADERGVEVERYADMSYAACGLIRPLGFD